MTEIDLPSFLQSLHFAAVGWDHSLSHSLAGQRPHSHYGLSSSLPQSCNRVRPRPPRNELNRKTESEGEGLRPAGQREGQSDQRSKSKSNIGLEELDVAARAPPGSRQLQLLPLAGAGRPAPAPAGPSLEEGRTHRTTGRPDTGLV